MQVLAFKFQCIFLILNCMAQFFYTDDIAIKCYTILNFLNYKS